MSQQNIKPEHVDVEVVLDDDEIAGIAGGGGFSSQTYTSVRVG